MALGTRVAWAVGGCLSALLACTAKQSGKDGNDTAGAAKGDHSSASSQADSGDGSGITFTAKENSAAGPASGLADPSDDSDTTSIAGNMAEPGESSSGRDDSDQAGTDATEPDPSDPDAPHGDPSPSLGDNGQDSDSSPEASEVSLSDAEAPDDPSSDGSSDGEAAPGATFDNPLAAPAMGPAAGNPDGACSVPQAAAPIDTSAPDHVVGTGSAESCTADAFIDAVALGGLITFDCGSSPVTITLTQPAKVYNDANDRVVIDGGGLVTLSGGGTTRILYMNTCDEALHWTSDHCNNQEFPELTVQNLTFIDANSRNEVDQDGGGAIFASGGRFRVVNSRFFGNTCADDGPDVGGGAIRVFQQYNEQPVYVVNSTFGGAEELANTGSSGGAISSIGVNWTILNSVFSYNRAIGGNEAEDGTEGGNGGAIYNDGGTLELSICGTLIEHNDTRAFGSGVFFVSNNHQGTLRVKQSIIRNNTGGEWNVLPGVSMHDDTVRDIDAISIIE